MIEVDVQTWVENAPNPQRKFREAVHIILDGIGHSRSLRARMLMKGGLLLAIRYASSRYTTDLDFSTPDQYSEESARTLIQQFEQGLAVAEDRLSYATSCRLQKSRVEPNGENRTHHNLSMSVGYADKSNPGAMARLQAKRSPQVVRIDYSFNEAAIDLEVLHLDGGATIRTYTLHNVLAEKLRSLLQQPARNRHRRQDVYDIWYLLEFAPSLTTPELARIHGLVLASCQSKDIYPTADSLSNESVQTMARDGYASLEADVDGDLPPFDEAMAKVAAFYRSLPW